MTHNNVMIVRVCAVSGAGVVIVQVKVMAVCIVN
jgi:hypothetical protein